MSGQTSYSVTVKYKHLDKTLARDIIEACEEHIAYESRDGDSKTIDLNVEHNETISYLVVKLHESIELHSYHAPKGRREKITKVIAELLTGIDDAEAEIIEFSPHPSHESTMMDTIVNGYLNEDIVCDTYGTPVVRIRSLITARDKGTLNAFVTRLEERLIN